MLGDKISLEGDIVNFMPLGKIFEKIKFSLISSSISNPFGVLTI